MKDLCMSKSSKSAVVKIRLARVYLYYGRVALEAEQARPRNFIWKTKIKNSLGKFRLGFAERGASASPLYLKI